MHVLLITALLCYLCTHVKGETGMARTVIAILGVVLWLLSCFAGFHLPACLQ